MPPSNLPMLHPDPTVDDHAIYFKEGNFRIPLSLRGIFSCFPSRKPSLDSMLNNDNVYLLTPAQCNTHSSAYAENEAKMLDWQGEIISPQHRRQIVIKDIIGSIQHENEPEISDLEHRVIEESYKIVDEEIFPIYEKVPVECDDVYCTMMGIDPVLDDSTLLKRLSGRAEIGSFCMNIGATSITDSPFISVIPPDDDESSTHSENLNEDELLDELYDNVQSEVINIDSIMALEKNQPMVNHTNVKVMATHAERHQGVNAEHLAKVWRITNEEAEQTLDVT